MLNSLAQYQLISAITATQSGNFIILHSNEISLTGTFASVFGFFLSCYVFYTAKRINRYILYSTRLPQLQREINTHASSIINLINSFDNSVDDIRAELIRCSANLKALRKKVPRAQKKTIDVLEALITSTASTSSLTKETARDIYLKLLFIAVDIQNLQKDFQVEK